MNSRSVISGFSIGFCRLCAGMVTEIVVVTVVVTVMVKVALELKI